MIARLVLILMLAIAAVPGMAAGAPCHEPPAAGASAMAAMPGMPEHRDHTAPAEHRCIGCLPLPERVSAPRVVAPARIALPRPRPVRFDVRAAGPPALPPPRIG